jgi:hypothetical protein
MSFFHCIVHLAGFHTEELLALVLALEKAPGLKVA